jgi:hypothetical protein
MTKITLAACFIWFFLCSAAVAYYSIPIVRECPHCKSHFVHEETVSGNTIGSVLYTDGKENAPMLPDQPWLVKCPRCKKLFWFDEALKIDTGYKAAEGLPSPMWPSEVDLLNFISSSKPSGKNETNLRLISWRTANDAWRSHPFAKSRFSEEQKNNMRTLSHLLDDTDEIQRILKAEIARELGEFNNCKRLLFYEFADQFSYAASIIRQLAEEGDSRVRLISSSKSEPYKPRSYPSSRKSRIKIESE